MRFDQEPDESDVNNEKNMKKTLNGEYGPGRSFAASLTGEVLSTTDDDSNKDDNSNDDKKEKKSQSSKKDNKKSSKKQKSQ